MVDKGQGDSRISDQDSAVEPFFNIEVPGPESFLFSYVEF